MRFEDFKPADLTFLHEFEPPGWGDLVPRFQYFLKSSFCQPIKAVLGNEMVAIGTNLLHENTAWLACVIVHPNHRSKGYGNLITERLIKNSVGPHIKTLYLDATEMGYPVYTKLGFEVETEYVHLKSLQVFDGQKTSDRILDFDEKYRNEIFRVDQAISGENRRKSFNGHVNNAKVFVENGHVTGFYLPTFADGPIMALTETAGTELMKYRFGDKSYAILPIDNETGLKTLHQNGFEPYRTSKRMRWGPERTVLPYKMYNRVNGQLG